MITRTGKVRFTNSLVMLALLASAMLSSSVPAACAADEEKIVNQSTAALHEIMKVPLKRIPESLLEDSEAVAIIPNVIKVGLVAGVQRGRGVVLIRDKDRNFGLPRFISITGGSIGWQVGAQATDFVLVFKSKRSVEGLLEGKFTIGGDVSAAAGPLGRRAGASTDLELRAELYSYSRSRGLFAGVSLDGSVIQLEPAMELAYYRPGPGGVPTPAPESAVKLLEALSRYAAMPGNQVALEGAAAPPADPAQRAELIKQELVRSVAQLQGLLDENWKRYLALPAEAYAPGKVPPPESLNAVLGRYETVARDVQFRQLNSRIEFIATHDLLREYSQTLAESAQGKISLPPPPGQGLGPVVR
jgi:lipid-binding SYLF domain-containing protein